MRDKFPKHVESTRVCAGQFASNAGDMFGMFFLRSPSMANIQVMVCDGLETGWDHVSVSLSKRCPTWDEMCWVKNLFFRPDEAVIQIHPPADQYVNDHPHCLHLWRPIGGIETPPPILVGVGRKSTQVPNE